MGLLIILRMKNNMIIYKGVEEGTYRALKRYEKEKRSDVEW